MLNVEMHNKIGCSSGIKLGFPQFLCVYKQHCGIFIFMWIIWIDLEMYTETLILNISQSQILVKVMK